MAGVFISYSRKDRVRAEEITEHLKKLFDEIWFDKDLRGGEYWWNRILDEIGECAVFIHLVSRDSLASPYCQAELNEALRLHKPIIPVRITPKRTSTLPDVIQQRHIIDMQSVKIENVIELYNAIQLFITHPPDSQPPLAEQRTPMPPIEQDVTPDHPRLSMHRVERLRPDQWDKLQQIAIQATTAGGTSAMTLYRQTAEWPAYLAEEERKNPSTTADLVATAAILQTLHPYLEAFARELHCVLFYMGEETHYAEWFQNTLSRDIVECIQPADVFFRDTSRAIRVIIDGIDGTISFIRGLPLFCSAIAILIEDQVRVSAIYDPIHHVVYSATLRGPYDHPDADPHAVTWEVASGSRIDMVQQAQASAKSRLHEEAIGVHFTRSHPDRLATFIAPAADCDDSKLSQLAQAASSIYALNSGILAMVQVARGVLGGFVNTITNPWDVAAGEVLVRACEGRVTNFANEAIDYSAPDKTSLITAKNDALHAQLLQILQD
ncbi:MAG: TIR domain-containing protein [Anaerolineae bacterium]|nr:TIR domain-containing protein [Anaerolineae bacterium]